MTSEGPYNNVKQNVTAEAAVGILSAAGLQVNIDQAKAVVNYLYVLAKTTLSNEKSNSLH